MTAAAKHTAGPWQTGDDKLSAYNVYGPAGDLVAQCLSEANASLIAAPELLMALEGIVDLTKPGQTVNISQATDIICDAWNVARAALSKAKGGAA